MQKPNHGVVYVAKEYPPWQHVTLVRLKKMYEDNGNQFPDNKQIMNILKGEDAVKKHMKKLMPFAQYVKVCVQQILHFFARFSCCHLLFRGF